MCFLWIVLVHPRVLVPEVDHLQEVGVEAAQAAGAAEGPFVSLGGASRYHRPRNVLLTHGIGDLHHLIASAAKHLSLGMDDIRQRKSVLLYLLHIENTGDV